jgi:hypothetical protein
MCALCGLPATSGHWTEAGARTPAERMRARLRRAAVLRLVLRAHGLDAHDGTLLPGVQLLAPGGRQVLASDLGVLWREAQRLLGAPVDPLDPRLLSELEGGGR